MTKMELHRHFTKVVKVADAAGRKAVADMHVTPMVVGTPKNTMASLTGSLTGDYDGCFDPDKPVYYVPDGVCGFAWVNVKAVKGPEGQQARKFQNWLKDAVKTRYPAYRAFGAPSNDSDGWYRSDCVANKPETDGYSGGVSVWVGGFNQSLQKKETYAHAFAAIVSEHIEGVRCYGTGRLD